MKYYISDIRYAVEVLVKTIKKEKEELNELTVKHKKLKSTYDKIIANLAKEQTEKMHEGIGHFNEDYQFAEQFHRVAEYEEEYDLNGKKDELHQVAMSILAKQDIINFFSIGLLQVAKQVIISAHGSLEACPDGRKIGKETLKNVIWQAREQAFICEEGLPTPAIKECFANLKDDFGVEFDITIDIKKSKAKDVVNLLKWDTYQQIKKDLNMLI